MTKKNEKLRGNTPKPRDKPGHFVAAKATKRNRMSNHALYEQDFYAWAQITTDLIRNGQWSDIDRDALAEEVESLGRSQHRELGSRLDVLVMHLLKWQYQPNSRQQSQSWRSTIRTQRRELRRLLEQNPSLRPLITSVIADGYADARLDASEETDLPLTTFPDLCPWTPAQVLDTDFWPVTLS